MNSRCILFGLNFILRVKVVGFYKKGNIFKQVFAIRKHWGKNTTTINIWSYSTIFYIVKMESGFKINILGEKMIGTHFLLLQKREDFFSKITNSVTKSPFVPRRDSKNNLNPFSSSFLGQKLQL